MKRTMKRIIMLMTVTMMVAISLSGCQKKHECFWCGETKVCQEKTLDGEKIYLCEDCVDELSEL